jgi:hypothetical protein
MSRNSLRESNKGGSLPRLASPSYCRKQVAFACELFTPVRVAKSFKGRQLTIGRTAGVASLVASSPGAIEAVLSLVEPPLKRFRFRGGRLSALP